MRSRFGLVCAISTFLAFLSPLKVAAQSYPVGPVRILVASAAGGSLDILARLVAQGLSEETGQTFIVDARPGAGGNLAIDAMLKADPDGRTLLFSGLGLASNPSLYRTVPYAIGDIAPISVVGEAPLLIMATPALPVNSISDLTALAHAKPGTIKAGILSGGSSQFASDMFRMMANIDMPNIPYKGGGQIFVDALAGNIDVVVLPLPESMPYVRSKQMKALGQTGLRRSPLAPDVPTVDESGVKGLSITAWYMLAGSAKLPPAIVASLNQATTKVLKKPQIQAKISELGIDAIGGSTEEAASFLRTEADKYAKVIKWSGAKVE